MRTFTVTSMMTSTVRPPMMTCTVGMDAGQVGREEPRSATKLRRKGKGENVEKRYVQRRRRDTARGKNARGKRERRRTRN